MFFGQVNLELLSFIAECVTNIENVSGYSRNPCSLNRERDTAFAAKLLTLPTGFFSAEKSEEWMARSPV